MPSGASAIRCLAPRPIGKRLIFPRPWLLPPSQQTQQTQQEHCCLLIRARASCRTRARRPFVRAEAPIRKQNAHIARGYAERKSAKPASLHPIDPYDERLAGVSASLRNQPTGKMADAASFGCWSSARRVLMAATLRVRTAALARSPCTTRAAVVSEVWLLRTSSPWLSPSSSSISARRV